jgi:8-oxo-dGTP pyrophosphatase MutT (NUDIX family)
LGDIILDKVTAFVVSEAEPRHLLVFDHPLAGTQLPSGTVEPGEEASEAAMREVREETGVRLPSSGIVLGVIERTLPEGRAVLVETPHSGPEVFRRGIAVEVLDTRDSRSSVGIRYREHDFSETPTRLLDSYGAQVSRAALARRVQRTFFRFSAPIRRRAWTRHADGHVFRVRWAEIVESLDFHGRQQTWYERFAERL